jgi:cytochrome c oxidase subunit 2
MAVFLVKYRYKPGRRSVFIHGNNTLESVWTLIPTVILAVLAVLSQDSWSRMKYEPSPGDDPLRVRVIAMQFKFYFQYPGPDGELGDVDASLIDSTLGASRIREMVGMVPDDAKGEDDVILDMLVVPKDRTVIAEMISIDVIHSFFLPNFRVKQDVVPGMTTSVWFNSSRTSAEVVGRNPAAPTLEYFDTEINQSVLVSDAKPFDIVCAELCGAQHYTMRGRLFVVSEPEFNQYIQNEYAARQEVLNLGDFGY